LQRITGQGFSRIVVQPHLLFEGELVTSVKARIAEMAVTAQTQWLVTAVLADPPGKSGPATASLAAAAFDQFVRSIRVVASARDD
jgi:hypothetical protein